MVYGKPLDGIEVPQTPENPCEQATAHFAAGQMGESVRAHLNESAAKARIPRRKFLRTLRIDYPDAKEERMILDRMSRDDAIEINKVVTPTDIMRVREVVKDVYVDDRIKDYIVQLVLATRRPQDFKLDLKDLIQFGASPRATIFLAQASRAHAFVKGRGYVTPEDIKAIGLDVLRHRIILTYEAEAEEVTTEFVISKIFDAVQVP